MPTASAVFSGGAGGARAPLEFGGSQKGQSLISAYQSLAITTNTPGFEKLNTALPLTFLCPDFVGFDLDSIISDRRVCNNQGLSDTFLNVATSKH